MWKAILGHQATWVTLLQGSKILKGPRDGHAGISGLLIASVCMCKESAQHSFVVPTQSLHIQHRCTSERWATLWKAKGNIKRHSRASGPLGLSAKRIKQTVHYTYQQAWGSVERLFQWGLQDLTVKHNTVERGLVTPGEMNTGWGRCWACMGCAPAGGSWWLFMFSWDKVLLGCLLGCLNTRAQGIPLHQCHCSELPVGFFVRIQ